MISVSAQALAGVILAGFQTTALPKASAGAIFHDAVAIGKFQGEITATTPSGSRVTSTSTPARVESACLAENSQRLGGEISEKLSGAIDLANAFRERLALLPGEQLAEFLRARHQFPADGVKHGCARFETRSPPIATGLARGGDGLMDIGGSGLRKYADEIGKVRRIAVLDFARPLAPLSRDEISSNDHWRTSQNFIDFI